MLQNIIVYIIVALAVVGAIRYGYRKLRAFRKNKTCVGCSSCPLKNKCSKPLDKKTGKGCCC